MSLDVVGINPDKDEVGYTNNCIRGFRYLTPSAAQPHCAEAAQAFHFLTEWLDVPLTIDPILRLEHSEIPYTGRV